MYKAMLRMDKEISNEARLTRVDEISLLVLNNAHLLIFTFLIFENFQKLNLKKCENTIIGMPEKGIKGKLDVYLEYAKQLMHH